MKTKIKRHSRSVLSVILAVCMLLSCFTAGIIASDAAKTESESVGIDETTKRVYVNSSKSYIHYYNDNNMSTNWPGKSLTVLSGNYKYADIDTTSTYAILNNNAGSQNQANPPSGWASNSDSYIIHSGSTWETVTSYFGTWTVAGEPTSLFGTSWSPTETSNDMTFSDTENAFVKTYTGVSLEAGTVQYKVVKNHDWSNGSKPSSNKTYTISEAGTYNVTIKYNPFTDTVSDSFEKQADPASNYTVTFGIGTGSASGTGTLTASGGISSGDSVTGGTSVTFTATIGAGQYIEGWYSDAACNTSLNNGTNTTYTTTVNTNTSVYVKFVGDISFYIKDDANWTNVAIYLYRSSGNEAWDWPGKRALPTANAQSPLTVTATSETGVYLVKLPANTSNINYIILNNNNDGSQTGDNVALVEGTLYRTSGINTPNYTPETAYNVTVKCGAGKFTAANNQTDQTVTAGATNAALLPEVTPPSGKAFKEWTITSGSGSITLNSPTLNGSASVNAIAAGGVVTATYENIGSTVVYVAKNDNVSKIYAWNSSGNISAGFPGDNFEQENGSAKVYDIGGVAYYKYTVNTGTKPFNFIVNNGSNARQSNNAENYAAGHTYYVQWYGTESKVDVKNMGTDWYPKYYLVYKPSSAEDKPANWTRVAFSNSEATLSSLTAQNYVFYIVRQDMVSGSYADHYWYNTGDKTITRANRTNVYTTHNNNATNIKLNADAPGDFKVVFDAMNGDAAVTLHADYPVGYRAVGNATFFGTAWDTTSSNYAYMFTQLATPYTDPDDNKVYTYSCSKTMDYSVGTFEFKAWSTEGADGTWYPAGTGNDIQVTNGVKRGQTITFYLNPTTGNVTYKITGEPSGESWPPSDIQEKMDAAENPLVEQNNTTYSEQYDTLIYKIATGSNAITSSPVTLTPLYQKTNPGTEGAWWADFTSVLPSIGTDQLYFNITSNGSYTGFYATSEMTRDTTEAPGISVKKADKDSTYYFVEVSGVESRVTNLGVYITKDASNNFTYKFYTIKGSASASKVVKVYAKDGAIRRNGTARDPKSNMDYSTFEKYANTFLTDNAYSAHMTGAKRSSTHGATGNDELTDTTVFDRYTYDYVTGVEKGSTIYFKTVLKNDTYMNQYYLVGYSINGTVYQLHAASESGTSGGGTVTESFTIPTDWDYDYVEITPIYFLRSGTSIRFYVEGYDQNVMDAGWGNTVGVYPYYQDPTNNDQVANVNNPFGGYPGQPMVFYKGNYYADIPKTYTAYTENSTSAVTCEIKGITLSNMYWDDVHLYTGEVSLHYQTYDFDDLYKIYKEYGNDIDNIICAFKYENRKNNDEPASFDNANSPATYTNGWELLKNYKGEAIDIFGTVLTNQAEALALEPTAAAVHVISQDYKSNCAGQYATEYAVYNAAGTKVVESGGKTTIVPSALAIKTAANFDNYDPQTKAFKGIYSALKADTTNVVGKPVFITYEKSIFGGGDKADRCDARWFFSKKNDPANAKTRIEYSDNLGETWETDTFNSNTATGSHSGSTAYFTGLSTEADNTPETAAGNTTTTDTSANANLDPRIGGGYYVFNATAGTGYKFVGWYILRDNYQLNAGASSYASGTTNFTSHAEIAKDGDIFVARFVKVTSGEFTINHRVHKDSTGFGDVYVQAVVKNSSGTTLAIYGATSGASATNTVTIPSSTGYISNNSGNTIEATFVPEPYGTSNFVNFYATVNDLLQGYNEVDYIKSITINMPGVEGYDSEAGIYAKVVYGVNRMFSASGGSPTQIVSSVTHYSKFALKTNIPYALKYTFKTRYYDNKTYSYSSTYTEAELRSYFYDQITTKGNKTIALDKQFVQSKAPFESNYREDLTWVVDEVTFGNNNTEGYLTAHQEELKWSTATVYDFTNAGAMQTLKMVAPYMKLFHTNTNTKPSFESTAAETAAINGWDQNGGGLYAPLRTTYDDNGETKPLYIARWDIYQLDSFTYKTTGNNVPKMQDDGINLDVDTTKSKLVAQSYSSVFNYVGYEDYAIVPVYSKTVVDRQGESDARTDSFATLLTVSRNHWNGTVDGNEQGGSYKDGADRIYVDFMLNYRYTKTVDGKTQNYMLSSTDSNIKVGFVIKSYTMVNGEKVYRTRNDQVISQTVLVDKSKIDNKNRLEYCYGFNNSQNNSQWGLMFEFTPFIVDTDNQAGSTGADVKIGNTNHKALYPVAEKDVLRGVNFYMIGKTDTDWE